MTYFTKNLLVKEWIRSLKRSKTFSTPLDLKLQEMNQLKGLSQLGTNSMTPFTRRSCTTVSRGSQLWPTVFRLSLRVPRR